MPQSRRGMCGCPPETPSVLSVAHGVRHAYTRLRLPGPGPGWAELPRRRARWWGIPGRRPDGPRRRDRARRDRLRGRAPARLDGGARSGVLPPRAPRRRAGVRLGGRPPFVEAGALPGARPPLARIRSGERRPSGIEDEAPPPRPLALLGVRSCDLHAIATQDRVFLGGRYVERDYAQRREGAFVVAVNCGVPGGTCFCASMGTGPRALGGYDLALTGDHGRRPPVPRRGRHGAWPRDPRRARDAGGHGRGPLGRARGDRRGRTADGTHARHPRPAGAPREEPGAPALGRRGRALPHVRELRPRLPDLLLLVGGGGQRPRRRLLRALAGVGHVLLRRPLLHPRRERAPSSEARYRQWLTHKFGTWFDQFGTSGCVGCGRCITWCPVGIDVTEELAAIRATDLEVDRADAG